MKTAIAKPLSVVIIIISCIVLFSAVTKQRNL